MSVWRSDDDCRCSEDQRRCKGCRSRGSVCAYGCGSPSYLSRPLTTGRKVVLRSYLVFNAVTLLTRWGLRLVLRENTWCNFTE
ncbi:unnamed protein product [Musa acuminata subsp. malaccensis]|uniref:(wild Malaysian banana) hypothetical protein n=1 Tax=Musa acuminata subsp. malaccensis TaxID=214687 RepID=A0A804KB67_MUSAM|nr:unnamed protein product [Musa acuminata subsp. malaccensis]